MAAGPDRDLRRETFDLLPYLINPTPAEKVVLGMSRGLVFLPIGHQSYAEVVADNPDHFMENDLAFARSIPALNDYVLPVTVEVGFIEGKLSLSDSPRITFARALAMIESHSQALQAALPDFRAVMLPATVYASADIAYAARNPGKRLFGNCFGWCLDRHQLKPYAVNVGRMDPSCDKFGAFPLNADLGAGDGLVGAVPAIVKVRSRY